MLRTVDDVDNAVEEGITFGEKAFRQRAREVG